MIIAIEGPSAAGKTTWCARQSWPVVPEYTPTGDEPDGSDDDRRAAYWTGIDIRRWQEAVELERDDRIVLCDSDPLKLHYSWCLARIGMAPPDRFEHQLSRARAAFRDEQLGLADLVLVSIPPLEVLAERRTGDASRRRRSFALQRPSPVRFESGTAPLRR